MAWYSSFQQTRMDTNASTLTAMEHWLLAWFGSHFAANQGRNGAKVFEIRNPAWHARVGFLSLALL